MENYFKSLCSEAGWLSFLAYYLSPAPDNLLIFQKLAKSLKDCKEKPGSQFTTHYDLRGGFEFKCLSTEGTSESLLTSQYGDDHPVKYLKEINPNDLTDKVTISFKKVEGQQPKFRDIYSVIGTHSNDSSTYEAVVRKKVMDYAEKEDPNGDLWNKTEYMIRERAFDDYTYSFNEEDNQVEITDFIKSRTSSPTYSNTIIGLAGLLTVGSAYCTYKTVQSFFREYEYKNSRCTTRTKVTKAVVVALSALCTLSLGYGTFKMYNSVSYR